MINVDSMRKYIRALLLILIFSISSSVFGGNIKITVSSADRSGKIEVGDIFYITVEAQNCSGSWNFSQSFGGAKLMYHPSQDSETISESNGYNTVTKSYSKVEFTLLAQSPGTYSYGPVSLGNTKSAPVKYKIYERGKGRPDSGSTASSQSNADNNATGASGPQFIGRGNENMFLKAFISSSKACEQEALVYTIKLYTTYNYIKFIGATSAPKFDGFVIEESKDTDSQFRFESVNGKMYKSAVVARYIIFPQKSGTLSVKGNTYTVSADAFEYYHDPRFSQLTVKRPVQLNLTPNDLNVQVLPLPMPQPVGFTGAVGQFSIASNLESKTFKTNQASSLDYVIQGRGNLKYIKLPELNTFFPSQLEVFTPESDPKVHVTSNNVEGSVTFKCSFIPLETGSFNIPQLKFVYFDPAANSYKTIYANGFHISVATGKSSEKSQTVLRYDASLHDIDKSKLRKETKPYIYSITYWLWYIIPFSLLMIACVALAYHRNKYSDIESLKSKRAAKMARRRLRKAFKCIKGGKQSLFYDEMLSALWGFLGDRLKMSTSDLTRKNVAEALESNNISSVDAQNVIKLIDDCEFAKYTSGNTDFNMHDIYQRGVDSIRQLSKV